VALKVRVRDDAALLFGQTSATGVPPSCPPTRTAE
jgi:hypothetical protein